MYSIYKRLSVSFFGNIAEIETFQKLGPNINAAGINILPKTYASIVISTTIISYLISLIAVISILSIFQVITASFMTVITVPIMVALLTFITLYYYPSQRASSMKKSIDNDLPFALAHLSAIASAGISPEYMFELLTGFKEYKNISHQASRVVRNIRVFGMSSVTAINNVAETTPSPSLKQVLTGISFNIEKGGNLVQYMKQMADKGLFEYRMKREKYLKTLSTYADIYAALLVAAPLMMLAVLGILAIIGGEILGFAIPELITILTFVILPILNITFLAFIHFTYPGA